LGFLQKCTQQFDVIFADPPFDVTIHSQIKMAVFSRNLLREGGLLIIEHGKQTTLSEETNFVNKRTFGNVNFSFFQ
jgi:16S rRNA (guanine966-N2)-methyltransferase